MQFMNLELFLLIFIPFISSFIILILDKIKDKFEIDIINTFVMLSVSAELFIIYHMLFSNFSVIKSGDFFITRNLYIWGPPFSINFAMDNLSFVFSIVITSSMFLITIFSLYYIENKRKSYFFLFFLVFSSIQGAVLTADIFTLYLFIEIIAVVTTPLIAFEKNPKNTRAAMQYLFYGISGGVFYFISLILVYYNLQTLNMAEIAVSFHQLNTLTQFIIIFFFLLGLIIKLGIFPFHFWLPKAHSSCPSPISSILSGILLKVYLYIFLRIFWTVIGFEILSDLHISTFVLDLALVSSIMGHIFAVQADELKEMLAYSSIGHIGMILAVLMLNTEAGFYGGMLHIISHLLMKSGLFLASGYILKQTVSHKIHDFKGVGYKEKIAFASFVIICLGAIGMPPLFGFVSKWFVLLAFLKANHYFGAFIVIAGSLIAMVYYLRYISRAYEGKDFSKDKIDEFEEKSFSSKKQKQILSSVIYIFTFSILFFGLLYRVLDMPVNTAIAELLNPQKYINLILGG
ncbi:MAG: complex I subunit 5 family protein [Bacillota bacterium]